MFTRFATVFAISATVGFAYAASTVSQSSESHVSEEGIANCPKIVSREDWGAKNPNCYESVNRPVKYVVIHHTHTPPACYDRQNCSAAMRSMQRFHQDDRKWCDIGYNFAVGGDGLVYMARGWGAVGAHAPPYNRNSIGVTLIGDWQTSVPNAEMLNAVKSLIKCGVKSGHIAKDYKLIGHRQAKTVTACPGDALFKEIELWPHFSNEWINSIDEIKLLDSNAASTSSRSASGEEKDDTRDTHYQADRLRRRRHIGSS